MFCLLTKCVAIVKSGKHKHMNDLFYTFYTEGGKSDMFKIVGKMPADREQSVRAKTSGPTVNT